MAKKKVIRIDPARLAELAKRIGKRKLMIAGAAAVLVLLLLISGVSIARRSAAETRYARARNAVGDELYNSMYLFCQTYDQVNVPGVDLKNYVIPQMRQYFYFAQAYSNALKVGFGNRYEVLTSAVVESTKNAFEAYQEAFDNDTSPDEAGSRMSSCVEKFRSLIDTRFRGGNLLAA